MRALRTLLSTLGDMACAWLEWPFINRSAAALAAVVALALAGPSALAGKVGATANPSLARIATRGMPRLDSAHVIEVSGQITADNPQRRPSPIFGGVTWRAVKGTVTLQPGKRDGTVALQFDLGSRRGEIPLALTDLGHSLEAARAQLDRAAWGWGPGRYFRLEEPSAKGRGWLAITSHGLELAVDPGGARQFRAVLQPVSAK